MNKTIWLQFLNTTVIQNYTQISAEFDDDSNDDHLVVILESENMNNRIKLSKEFACALDENMTCVENRIDTGLKQYGKH